MRLRTYFLTTVLLFLGLPLGAVVSPPSEETDIGWPREIRAASDTIVVYQPQIEKWENNQISARAALSVAKDNSPRSTYGVIWFTARTEVDKEKNLVHFENLQVMKTSFPTAEDDAAGYRQVLQQNLPQVSWVIALDRLQANLAITQAEMRTSPAVDLKNDPPRVIISSEPAMLVLVDGKPVLRKVEGSNLLRVINTRALILLDEQKAQYWLRVGDQWAVSSQIDGKYQSAAAPAAIVAGWTLIQKAEPADESKAPEMKQRSDDGKIPALWVSSVPTELVEIQGKPEFSPVRDTKLLYVKNTSSDLFLDTQTQDHYLLVSGRWFRSKTLDGPWRFVAGKDLPADFSKIPDTHPKGDILASIPETPQAQEAVIENSVPQTASVDRQDASLTATYDGAPDFEPISGTPLYYAVNSPMPIIRIDTSTYYAVQNGVWFAATAAQGPWVVAASVPAVIYTIPPSSPLHYVTYVKVYGATPEVVYVGYTPGYLGSCVTSEQVVVYGTGWYYPPYIGPSYYWYGYPVTYGFGVRFHWNWWLGWGWGFGWAPVYAPWWGPFYATPYVTINNYYNTNVYNNVHRMNVYNHWPRHAGVRKATTVPWQTPKSKMFSRPKNNVFAGKDGQVYRHRGNQWEQNKGQTWTKVPAARPAPQASTKVPNQPRRPGHGAPAQAPAPTKLVPRDDLPRMLDRENKARDVGDQRWQRFFVPDKGAARSSQGHGSSHGRLGR